MADETEELIGRIADEYTDRLNQGEDPDIEEYAARWPDHEAVLREILSSIKALHRPEAESTEEASLGIPDHLGEYRLVREIGRGGMGIVFEAEQSALQRRVALKVLPRTALLSSTFQLRFEQEARAAARLHHTNIVPVFGVGQDQGTLFYAMQYIDGLGADAIIDILNQIPDARSRQWPLETSLTDAETKKQSESGSPRQRIDATVPISAPQEKENRSNARQKPTGTAPDLQQGSTTSFYQKVAEVSSQLGSALHYAHERGVLHRDIKPSNILIDRQGTSWITDFGLAKTDDDVTLTQDGDIIGTLRYMAPERFAGHSDARGDVYGLGVTLYELVTGQPAVGGTGRAEVMEHVQKKEPVVPRRLRPDMPRDLETIILKAIAREPNQRYATAQDMAGDLKRFVEGRPIQARRTPVHERVWLWCKRRPLVSALSFLLVVSLLTGMTGISLLYVEAERERGLAVENYTEAERLRAEVNRSLAEAERNFQRARQAVDEYFTQVSEEQLLEQPGLQELRRGLLISARRYYETFLKEQGDNLALQFEMAQAYARLGDIDIQIGTPTQSVDSHSKALAIINRLKSHLSASSNPRTSPARITSSGERSSVTSVSRGELVRLQLECLSALANARNALGKRDEALSTIDQCIALGEEILDVPETDPDTVELVARCHGRRGVILNRMGQSELAMPAHDRELEIIEGLLQKYPDNDEYLHTLARSHGQKGILLFRDRKPAGALSSFTECARLMEKAIEINDRSSYLATLAQTYGHIAVAHEVLGMPGVLEWSQKSIDSFETLATRNPAVIDYHINVISGLANHATFHAKRQQYDQAFAMYEKAADIQRRVMVLQPDSPNHLAGLTRIARNAATTSRTMREWDTSLAWSHEAIGSARKTIENDPRNAGAIRDLVGSLQGRAVALTHLERYSEALASWDEANQVTEDPQKKLGTMAQRAVTIARTGDYAAAASQVAELERSLSEFKPMDIVHLASALIQASVAVDQDQSLEETERKNQSDGFRSRAFELLEIAVADGLFDIPDHRRQLAVNPYLDPIRESPQYLEIIGHQGKECF